MKMIVGLIGLTLMSIGIGIGIAGVKIGLCAGLTMLGLGLVADALKK